MKCKIRGFKQMYAEKSGRKFVIYMGEERYSNPVTRIEAKMALGITIPKRCK